MPQPSTRVTSRLLKRERKKILKQTAYFTFVAVVIILAFIFVILPGFLAILNKFLNTNLLEEADTLPPQVPIVSAPANITNKANLTVDGYGEPGSDVFLMLNAIKSGETTVSDEGQFSFEFKLTEGENTIEFYSVDKAGNQSNNTRTYTAVLDTENPDIEISEPQDGATFNGLSGRNITLRGKTDPSIRVNANGRQTFATSEGDFSLPVELQEGENTLEIKAIDQAGNESERTITVSLKL